MTGGRNRRAAVLAVLAALTALAGLAGITAAAPAAHAGRAAPPLPPVWPPPRQLTQRPGVVALPATVTEVVSPDTDPAAVSALAGVLHAAGVRTISQLAAGAAVPSRGLTFYLGTPGGNTAISPALAALAARGPAGLPAGGYVLAAGHAAAGGTAGNTVVLAGADAAGTFYAVQRSRRGVAGGDRRLRRPRPRPRSRSSPAATSPRRGSAPCPSRRNWRRT